MAIYPFVFSGLSGAGSDVGGRNGGGSRNGSGGIGNGNGGRKGIGKNVSLDEFLSYVEEDGIL